MLRAQLLAGHLIRANPGRDIFAAGQITLASASSDLLMGCRYLIADSALAHTEVFSVPGLLPVLSVCFHAAKPGLRSRRATIQTKGSCVKGGGGQVTLPIPPVSVALTASALPC